MIQPVNEDEANAKRLTARLSAWVTISSPKWFRKRISSIWNVWPVETNVRSLLGDTCNIRDKVDGLSFLNAFNSSGQLLDQTLRDTSNMPMAETSLRLSLSGRGRSADHEREDRIEQYQWLDYCNHWRFGAQMGDRSKDEKAEQKAIKPVSLSLQQRVAKPSSNR